MEQFLIHLTLIVRKERVRERIEKKNLWVDLLTCYTVHERDLHLTCIQGLLNLGN